MRSAPILSSLLAAAALAACNPPPQAKHEAFARPVLVATIHYAPRQTTRALPGVVKARTESEISFRVSGRLERRLVDAGDFVHKGDALAHLDATDFKLQREQAEADLASARSTATQAEAEEKRITSLTRQGWSASADFDKTRAAADQSRAAVIRAERALALATNALSYATLTADADGVVSATEAEPGQMLAVGAPVVRLSHTDVKEAAVAIPEALVDRVRASRAQVEYWALPGVATPATLRELSPNADPATRTYAARFSLPGAPASAKLGMSVTVTLDQAAPPVASVPLGALFESDKGPSVWMVDSTGAVTAAPVVVAGANSGAALIVSGVAEGAEIVALGAHKLDAKQRVRVVTSLAGL